MEYALKLSNVCKEYDSSEFALDNVTFDLPTGTVMGFVGENGAGKTTTIGCILNTLKKDKGSIEIFGKEMNDNDIHIRENIGVVYDGDNFPNYLSAKQLSNIMAGIYKQWDITLFNKYLEIFSLNSNQKISKYSKGMTMKLAIAVALSHHPNLLILDEATSALDSESEMLVQSSLDKLMTGRTSIIIAHRLSTIVNADKIIVMDRGKIVEIGTHKELLESNGRYSELYRMQFKDVLA